MTNAIIIHGARMHNLKNIDVEIPRNRLVVITGVSGSGKSSLAFDTIYAEGQRRYVESLSAYARQFLERMEKPDVDVIQGICPAIAIEQKNRVRNARSTVGTTTELYDYLRVLFARIGKTFCAACHQRVQKDSVDFILKSLFTLEEGTRFLVTFPLSEYDDLEHGQWQQLKDLLIRKGFLRVLVKGEMVYLEDETCHVEDERDVLVVVDRLALKEDIRQRVTDALETAYQEGNGRLVIWLMEEQCLERGHPFSRTFECARCGIEYKEPEPQMFSFNNPSGACPECHGFGDIMTLDMNRVIPDWSKSIREGAVVPWTTQRSRGIIRRLAYIAPKYGFSLDTPLEQLNSEQHDMLIEGNSEFIGVKPFFEFLEEKKYKMHVRVFLSKYRGYTTCPVCHGSRLNEAAGLVRVGGLAIHEVAQKTIAEAKTYFETLPLTDFEIAIADRVIEEIRNRLHYLVDVGLGDLTMNRLSRTLSGGEAQRIHLAASLGTSLVSSLYVLDEPTIGLHPRDTRRLISILKSLRDRGNTVLVVEHDADMIQQSEYVIDIGPKAGEHGGEVVFAGTPGDLCVGARASCPQKERGQGVRAPGGQQGAGDPTAAALSLTGQYLRGERVIPLPERRRSPSGRPLRLEGVSEHNLKDITVEFPPGVLICVTGVSGSGKSTLIEDVLYKALKGERHAGNGYQKLSGQDALSDVVMVDQSPIGRTPRSNPVTYIKAFDGIRKLFAKTRLSRERGYTPGTFSYNVAGGRCDTCDGNGLIQVDMQFLTDVYVTCDTCQGTRFKPDVLEVTYQRHTIYDVLNLTVDEAIRLFLDQRPIVSKLRLLQEAGLGYLRLGQPATTLSGGEAQRIKLAAHLAAKRKGIHLYLFDEPTTGLHFADIAQLLHCLTRLIEQGHSVLVIEHNLNVIKCADYIIDLGPEGGGQGGNIVACGTPEEISRNEKSYTGKYLKPYLQ